MILLASCVCAALSDVLVFSLLFAVLRLNKSYFDIVSMV